WKVIRKEPPLNVYWSTAVYSNTWGGGNVWGEPTGLKLTLCSEPVVESPKIPPEAVTSPVTFGGPFVWKTSAIEMLTLWGGVAAAGATNNIVAVSAVTARGSSLRMIVLLSGAVRRLACAEFYCPIAAIHYAHRRRPVNPLHRPALQPRNRGADSRPHRVPRRGR